MKIFFIWILIILAVTGLMLLVIRKKEGHGSGFRIKLTAFFVLFVIVPTVPFVFFSANLFTHSMNMLLLPGMNEVLNKSLDTVRKQAEEKGQNFLSMAPIESWSESYLKEYNIDGAVYLVYDNNKLIKKQTISHKGTVLPDSMLLPLLPVDNESVMDKTVSRVFSFNGVSYILIATWNDHSVKEVYYQIPQYVIKARDDITRAIEIQSTLLVFKESLLEKNVIWSIAVVVIGLLVFLSFYAARKLANQISRPIKKLVYGMERVKQGDISFSVDVNTNDEFQFLGESFNAMVKDLKISRERLKAAERIAAWRQVARAISHEIKNSLTPISLSVRRLRSHFGEKELPANVNESLTAVEDELRSLSNIAAEFSNFARMPKPNKEELNINEIVSSVFVFMEPLAENMDLSISPGHDIPRIFADKEQVKRVLINLMKNSIEACRQGDKIEVSTEKADMSSYSVKLIIKDTGVGMDEDTLQRVFNPDFTTKRKGTGLGLVIVRKIVQDHNGKITVNSKQGQGTEFVLYF